MKRDEGNEIDERSPERKRDFQTMPNAPLMISKDQKA